MKKIKGFTLIELVTAIALVVILTVISAPIYNSYAIKGKQVEGYTLLGTIRSAQDNYFNEYNCYLRASDSTAGTTKYTNNDTLLGINAKVNSYYTWFNINDNDDNLSEGYKCFVTGLSKLALTYNRTTGVTIEEVKNNA